MEKHPDKLIIVAGHAAFKDSIDTVPDDPANDAHWVLQSFQHGEPPYYIEHIRKGTELLAEDEVSLRIFSGGRTRREAGHWSEAATYRAIAEHYDYWTHDAKKLMARTALELYARDSFQNLQLSLYEFYRLTGKYPDYVTVVGWQFKAVRFDQHRTTLEIPAEKFTYVGCNNPADADLAEALKGEAAALRQFQEDPTGSHSPLADKREARNPFNEQHPYDACPPIEVQMS